jgi:ATP-dependent RNA helicase RhlE
MKFERYSISPQIKNNLEKMGLKRPTDIQFKAIPHILKGEDLLAIAQTGTGKTAAFAIPVVNNLEAKKIPNRPDGIKCIVMVPTHELAIQISGVFEQVARGTNIKTYCIHGGVDQNPQIENLEKGFDVLVATPGRMFDLVSQGYLRLNRVEVLILDEADHMLDLGFIKDIQQLVQKLPNKRQTLFFSATINEKIKKLAYSLVKNAIRIQISPKNPVARNIDHYVTFIKMDDKRFFLERLVNENPEKKMLIFVRTKVRAERVAKAMERVDIQSQTIHSDKDQKVRSEVMKNFRSGDNKILIATDVSARGIDIPNVDYVVNYDLPEQTENYVHRVGRTGRGSNRGHAVSFCSEEERPLLEEIEGFLGSPIEVFDIEKDDYRETLASSHQSHADWKTLMKEAEAGEKKKRKKKKK